MDNQNSGNIFKAYSLEITILVAALLVSSTMFVTFGSLSSTNAAILSRLSGGPATGAVVAGANQVGTLDAQAQGAGQLQNIQVDIGDSPATGSANAPVTIVQFEDPSCPFCAAAHGENQQVISYLKQRDPSWQAPMPQVIADYVASGKVKLVYKYFPGHGKGEDAMKILWCSNEQGKFWDLLDDMYANQDLMEADNLAGLKAVATSKGVDSAALETCLASGKYNSRFQSETAQGSAARIGGTPGFIINGRLVEGAVSYPQMKQAIEAALAG